MDTIEITIDSLSYGGAGVGRVEGIVYFVPFSCPGDRLEVRITEKEKRYRRAEIVRIIEASPERVEPPCPYAGICGGCQWQHVSYRLQIESKTRELVSALKKAGISEDRIPEISCVPSPKEFGYRRTARFKTEVNPETGITEKGFYRENSRELVKIERCLLLDDRLNEVFGDIDADRKGLAGFDLFLDESGEVTPFYRFSEKEQGADFFQVNSGVNALMTEFIEETAGRLPEGFRLLDLYCGDGNLSLRFTGRASEITGWDYSKTAVERGNALAEKAAAQGSSCRIRYHAADVVRSWKHIAAAAKKTDIIILDPPRRGLRKLAQRTAALGAPLLIYISCSPPALARDLRTFTDNGYRIEDIKAFDMFPQTYHLETAAVLVRS